MSGYFESRCFGKTGYAVPDIVRKLNRAINDSLSSDSMKQMLAKIGFESNVGAPEDFAAFIAEEIPKWATIVKVSGAKVE